MRIMACADSGLLIELDDLEAVVGLYEHLQECPPPAVVDMVPGGRTLLLKLGPAAVPDDIVGHVMSLGPRSARLRTRGRERVEIPVVYDGPDLASVCDLTGLSRTEVIEEHTSTEWTVAFFGFAPGFSYLVGDSTRLRVPRLAESRIRVPPGSVGLAETFSGIYPRESPGGWRLIGRTDLVLWSAERDPPALLSPGSRVRFVDIGGTGG